MRFSPALPCDRRMPYPPTLCKSCNFLLDCEAGETVSLEREKGLVHAVKWFRAPSVLRYPGFLLSFLCFYFLNTKWLACHPGTQVLGSPFPFLLYQNSLFTLSAPRSIMVLRAVVFWFGFTVPFSFPSLLSSPHLERLMGYLYKHLRVSASLLALFDPSEKVHFTREPSCMVPSS